MSTTDEAIARIAIAEIAIEKLQAGQERIEALLLRLTASLPPEAAPPAEEPEPKPRPGHVLPGIDPNNPNLGGSYGGTPTPIETVARGGGEWARRHDDDTVTLPGQGYGIRHSREGRAIRPGAEHEPRPIGPPRDHQHDDAVRMLDRMIEKQEKE
jgi:hypothetical protein